jgi:SAM-dependent methyltransferase
VEHLAPTEAMLAPITEPLIDALALDGAMRVGDIGCGGGRTTRAIAARLPRNAVVHGIDISPDVIDAARAACRASDGSPDTAGLAEGSIDFFCADAGSSAPRGPTYDRLTSRFGVMFFDDPPAAFANIAGWLRPGGRFAFAVWGPLGDNPWMSTLRRVVAEEVEVPAPPPDSPGPFRYADAGRFCELLENAGFRGATSQLWRGAVELGGGLCAADAAAFCLRAFSVGDLLEDDAERLARVRERLTSMLRRSEVDGIVRMRAAVHIVTGSR